MGEERRVYVRSGQVWAQMVRHNGTIARLTSYNLSMIMKRHRATGTLSVSSFLEYTDAPLLHATALTVYSYNDALARYDVHKSKSRPLWIKDPYRGQTEAERKKQRKAAQVAEREAKKARRGPAPTSEDEADADEEDDDEDKEEKDDGNGNNDRGDADQSDNDDGSSGNNAGGRGGASGGGGRDRSGSGPGSSGGGGSGPNDGGRPRRSGRLNANRGSELELDAVHLAFKAPEKHLWSTGFSHFTRLKPKAAPDITPVQEFPPVSFPVTSRLGTFLPEYPSDQRRRVSGGSARSSASSASTRTSVPSLFSEPTSSAPTSPSTTSSFTHASSRGSSPFPEKASHDGGAHPPTSATSVCDAAGIVINAVLGESAIGTVWSGRLIPEDGTNDDYSIAIAVKMAIAQDNDEDGREDPRDAIRWESSVYDLLVKSGKQAISPKYYGAFEDRLGTVALVLDNAGIALQDFKAAKKPFRQALLAKAVEMHSAGIYHNDLVPRNIVQDSEGELRIIDFHIADLNHRCRGEDKCEELVAFRAALGL
ncbi:hypothetical protein C8R46DRAFT_1083583 [Mycena filopes]|nr:hypothetical protein C8R46DRAFT_1083583 [Mycena filopes]